MPPAFIASRAVHGEIEQNRLELGGVRLDGPHAAAADDFKRDVLAERLPQELGETAQQPVDVEGSGIERLLPGESQQPLGEGCGALRAAHRVLKATAELDLPTVRPRFHLALRALEVTDDDREKIVEIVRDAAGEMADRFHLHGLPQRFLGSHTTVDLFIQMLRPAQDREQGQEKNERRRDTENQMGGHTGDPLVANGGTCDSGAQVQGRFTEAAHTKTPLDQVDGRGRRVKAALRVLGNGAAEASPLIELFRRASRGGRVARQESAVRAQHGILHAGGIGQGREEANEVAREHGGFEDSCEHAVTGQPPADREEWLTVELGVIDLAIVGPDVCVDMRAVKIPVGIALLRRGMSARRDQGAPVLAVDPDRLHDSHRVSQLLELEMESLLVVADVRIGHPRDEIIGTAQCQFDDLKGLTRLLLLHVERPDDPLIGQRLDIAIAGPGGEREKKRRNQQRCGHRKPHQPDRQRPCLHIARNPAPRRRRLSDHPGKRQPNGDVPLSLP